jgi:hypothetical protein
MTPTARVCFPAETKNRKRTRPNRTGPGQAAAPQNLLRWTTGGPRPPACADKLDAVFRKRLRCKNNLERAKGFEPSTPTLARSCSTPELHPHPLRLPESHRRRPAELCQMRPPNATARTAPSKKVSGKNRPDRLANRLIPTLGPFSAGDSFRFLRRAGREVMSRTRPASASQVRFFQTPKAGRDGNRLKFPAKPPSG